MWNVVPHEHKTMEMCECTRIYCFTLEQNAAMQTFEQVKYIINMYAGLLGKVMQGNSQLQKVFTSHCLNLATNFMNWD